MSKSLLMVVAFLLLVGCAGQQPVQGTGFAVSPEGVLSYPAERGEVQFGKELMLNADYSDVYRISYPSAGTVTIYGLLREVKGDAAGGNGGAGENEKAAIVLLPGAGRTKEQEQELAQVLAGFGYTTLSIDQRGEGESKDVAVGLQEQYAEFLNGEEVFEYKRVYDALLAFDVLRALGHEKIIFMGESMGGRYAIMAGAVEPRALGVVGIATSGYGFGAQADANMTRFARSIDPDTYVGRIAPRWLVMMHSPKDPVIPIDAAKATYAKSGEPHEFIEVECVDAGNPTHGWCAAMDDELKGALDAIVST